MNFLTNIIHKKEINEKVMYIKSQFDSIEELYQKIVIELDKCEMLNKHETTEKLLVIWRQEHKDLLENEEVIKEWKEELDFYIEKNKYGKMVRFIDDVDEQINLLKTNLEQFYDKINRFTTYEYDSNKMALNLKSRLKDLTSKFDQNLKIIDAYNSSFLESTTAINLRITEFEEIQIIGEYPKARKILKKANKLLEKLEVQVSMLIKDLNSINAISEQFKDVSTIENQMNYLGYKTLSERKMEKINDLNKSKEELYVELTRVKLSDENLKEQKELSDRITVMIDSFDEEVSDLIDLNKKIEELENLKEVNGKLIKLTEELLTGALQEKEEVVRLYNLENINHLEKLDEEATLFETFKKDYSTLQKIILEEKINFDDGIKKMNQSSKYLNRVLDKIKYNIKVLEAMRKDEINVRTNLANYSKDIIDIDFYLKENNHYKSMSSNILSIKKDLNNKICELNNLLNEETIDISYLRTIDNVIERLFVKYIDQIETEIKQKEGVEKLMSYYSRFIINDETFNIYKHFINLYNNHEYKKVLKGIYQIFIDINPKGDELYKNIVSQVEIAPYERA